MIKLKKYEEQDYSRIIKFLREEYKQNKNEGSWLAQRWEDMEYRCEPMNVIERGKLSWHRHIFVWEDCGEIVAILNSEGGPECWMHIHSGYEFLFEEMLKMAETNIAEKGNILTVLALKSQSYREKILLKHGYTKNEDIEEISFLKRAKCNKEYSVNIKEGFKVIVGTDGLNHLEIFNACGYGFHPEDEGKYDNIKDLPASWAFREKAPMFDYKYEVIVKAPNGETASYSYVWVDKSTKSGYIEPVSTRQKYRRLGFGKAVQQATLNLMNEIGVEYCYVNPFGKTRDKFYTSAGYKTFDYEYQYKKQF
ncbi:MAG: hypothetical protein J6T74_03670 [Clostridia bacterium]|nr:hypothetical protein [Clostridia bacterium]